MPEVCATYHRREDAAGDLWLDVNVNGLPFDSLGPFQTDAEFNAVLEDLQDMLRHTGAIDVPKVLS